MLATGVSTVGGVNLIGVAVHASVTGNTLLQLWAGTTATATAAGVALTGLMTFVSASPARQQYLPIPAYCSGGLALNCTGDTTDITLYWNPA